VDADEARTMRDSAKITELPEPMAVREALSKGKVSMFELQKLLTDSTPQMTQLYAHLHDETLCKALTWSEPCSAKFRRNERRLTRL